MEQPAERRPDKTRRPKAGPRASPPGDVAAEKVKATFHLTREASQRLDVHCTMANLDRSAMVEKLIRDHLRRYVVSDRGGEGGGHAPRLAGAPGGDDVRAAG